MVTMQTIKENIRSKVRVSQITRLFYVLLIEADADYALALKKFIEESLPAEVTIVRTAEVAKRMLEKNQHKFFIGITSVLNVDSSAFEKVDLLAEFHLPVIAIVDNYEDEMRDQLIKHNVVDYVLKSNKFDSTYICNLILRLYKNSNLKVLVVDDSKVSRFVMTRELGLQKFTVEQARNGEEALYLLKMQGDIKLVLVDSQMPTMDGYTFTAKAREIYNSDELMIVGVSGSADPRIAAKFLKAGANDFIAKPFNYEMLLCRVSRNLDMLDAIEHAKKLSHTDFLSGLYNRRYFFEQGSKILKSLALKSSDDSIAMTVMIMDIDFFKKINDQFGHDVGDEVIKNFASILKRYFADDLVARIGGEEFAVISLSSQHLTSYNLINAFRKAVADQSITIHANELNYTCSIGVNSLICKDLDEMLAHADKHLYKAKHGGRNQISGASFANIASASANALPN
jgi:diguanylate cyclase (GGDEF)-like protein